MRVNKDNQKNLNKAKTTAVQQKSDKKAPGTRYGTLEDWRGSDNRSSQDARMRRNARRDGR